MQVSKKEGKSNILSEKIYTFWDKYSVIIVSVMMATAALIHIIPPFNADIINYDSAYQFFLTRHNMSEIMRLIPEDYSPPLYTVLLKGWTLVFGETLAAMRSFSMLIMWGMIFLAAFPVRAAFGKRASVLCMLLNTLSYINFLFVPEIRPTVLAYFFVAAAAIYAYLAFFFEYRYAYVCMTVFSILAMYTHNIAMMAALSFYIFVSVFSLAEQSYKKMMRFLVSGVICAAAYIPWLGVVLKQFGNVKKNYWSSSEVSIDEIISWTCSIHFKQSLFMLLIIVILCITLLLCLLKFKNIKSFEELGGVVKNHRTDIKKSLLLLCFYAGPIGMILLFSIIGHPIITPRYFYLCSAIVLIALAAFVGKFADKKTYAAFAAIIIACFCVNLFNEKKELDESDFAEMIETISKNEDAAFLHIHEWSMGIMTYYFPNADHYVCDDTWCVLNTLDVFPTEITNINNIDNIKEYRKEFYIFGGTFPDSSYELYQYFLDDGNYTVDYIGQFKEPYTYQKNWSLYNVRLKD